MCCTYVFFKDPHGVKWKKKKGKLSLFLSLYQVTTEYQSLHQGCSQYEALSLSLLRKKKEAETTFVFWKIHSGKTTVSTIFTSFEAAWLSCYLNSVTLYYPMYDFFKIILKNDADIIMNNTDTTVNAQFEIMRPQSGNLWNIKATTVILINNKCKTFFCLINKLSVESLCISSFDLDNGSRFYGKV